MSLLVSFQGLAQVDVTLRLDMSGQTISSDGVHVAGTINGWSTDSTPLTQEGTTDIYSATVQLSQGWHRYKFLNGNNWGTEESAGYPCAPSNGDRFLYINDSGDDVVLEAVPFNGCNPEGTGFSVTFNVDMSSEPSVSGDGIHLAGWHTDWNPGVLSLPDVDGDIHSGTLRLPTPSDYPIEFEYKYLNGNNWGTDETPGPESECSTVSGDNRLVTVTNSGENLYDVFNGCNYTLNLQNFEKAEIEMIYNRNNRKLEFLPNNKVEEVSLLQVYSINGKEIKRIEKIKSIEDVSVDFNDTKNGIYIVRFVISGYPMAKKVAVY